MDTAMHCTTPFLSTGLQRTTHFTYRDTVEMQEMQWVITAEGNSLLKTTTTMQVVSIVRVIGIQDGGTGVAQMQI